MHFRIVGYQVDEATNRVVRRVSDALDNHASACRLLQKGLDKNMLEHGFIQVYTSKKEWKRMPAQPVLN